MPCKTPVLVAAFVLLITLALSRPRGALAGDHAVEAAPPTANDILRQAFRNLYDCDTLAETELVIRSRSGAERRRVLQTASKRLKGGRRALGRLIYPPDLRGMSILTMESQNGRHDAFVYLPSQKRVRRITTAQRNDAILGSDLTYEDIERRHVDDYRVELLPPAEFAGEESYRILATPRKSSGYDHVQFLVAKSDWALLEVRYFRGEAEQPVRIIRMRREDMQEGEGHVLPTRLVVENLIGGTTTEVTLRNLRINPEIEDRIFQSPAMERNQDIPQSD